MPGGISSVKPRTLRKRFHKNPSTSYAGSPPLKGRLFYIQAPLEEGAGSRRLTEGLLRKSFTPSKRFHKEPLHRLRRSPSPFRGGFLHSGSPLSFIGSPLGHPQGVPCAELSPQVTEGYFRVHLTHQAKDFTGTPPPASLVPLPFQGRLFYISGSPWVSRLPFRGAGKP